MKTAIAVLGGSAFILALLLPAAAQEADAGKEGAESKGFSAEMQFRPDNVNGADEFQRYCTLCHGADGRGLGPVTEAMQKVAADLTQISKRNNGAFPFTRIADTIRDGGNVAEHKPKGIMPHWGKIFSDEGDPVLAKAMIFELTRYIETLQEK